MLLAAAPVQTVATLSVARYLLAATTVGTKAVFAGGYVGNSGASAAVDIYDNATGQWSTATLSQARYGLAAATVGTKALFAGGCLSGTTTSARVDIYDAATGKWSTAALSQPRCWLAATTVGTKAIFAGGGYTSPNGGGSATVDIYDDSTGKWSTAALSQARQALTATTVGGKAIFAGGAPNSAWSSVVDIYDGSTGSWYITALSQARSELAAASVGTKAVFAGGWGGTSAVDIYDASAAKWSTAALSQARGGLAAASVGARAIFAGGGYPIGIFGGGTFSTVDIYDDSTAQWSTAALFQARGSLAGTSVGGKAMFAGGFESTGAASRTVDILDFGTPATPGGFAATSGVGQVSLTWSASSGATSYDLYRSTTTGGEGSTPYKTRLTGTSFTDTAVNVGQPYYYQITAVSGVGESAKSAEKSATPQAPPTIPTRPGSFTATSGVGQVALTWSASSGATSYRLYRSTTAGGEGATPYKTGLTGTSFNDTAVTVGQPYYYQITAVNGVGESGKSAEKWATPTGVQSTPAKAFANGRANDMVYDSTGRLHLVYFDASSQTLKYASRSFGGTWSAVSTVDSAAGAGQYLSLAVNASNLLAVAYYDAANADLKYAQYNGSSWDKITVDSSRKVGLYPSLAFNSAGHPVISYYNKTYGDLKLAAWSGSSWSISTVDANADSGRYSSLAANPATGRWAIAYENDSDGTFRLAEQSKAGWGFTVVDDTQGGGGYTSLAFNSAGGAGLSYYDAWNTNLKFATRSPGSARWAAGTVASAGSQGMYGQLHYASGSSTADILFYNKTADAVMSCSGYQPGAWSTTPIVNGGGRELSAAWSSGGKRTVSWFDTASVGLLVQDL